MAARSSLLPASGCDFLTHGRRPRNSSSSISSFTSILPSPFLSMRLNARRRDSNSCASLNSRRSRSRRAFSASACDQDTAAAYDAGGCVRALGEITSALTFRASLDMLAAQLSQANSQASPASLPCAGGLPAEKRF